MRWTFATTIGALVLLSAQGATRADSPSTPTDGVRAWGWSQAANVEARRAATFTYHPDSDPAKQRAVLFGGLTQGTRLGAGTWLYDAVGNAWSLAAHDVEPPLRAFAAAALDTSNRVILFGGREDALYLNDTWAWDGTRWADLHPASAPAPRVDHALASLRGGTAGRNGVLLFGGYVHSATTGDAYAADTWRYDGADWTRLTPAHAPSARGRAVLVGSANGRAILSSGLSASGAALDDLWEWDGTDWIEYVANRGCTACPRARYGASGFFDSGRASLVVSGGFDTSGAPRSDGWRWNGSTWIASLAEPPGRGGAAATYDSDHAVGVLTGGSASGSSYGVGDTYTWNADRWSFANHLDAPSQRSGHAAAYDAERGTVVLFGGNTQSLPSAPVLQDTWIWNGAWREPQIAVRPPPRQRHAMAWDAVRKRVVLYGGVFGIDLPQYTQYRDTWTWDGASWIQQAPAHSPPVYLGHAMAWDPSTNGVLLFGGELADGAGHSAQTWLWNGSDWLDVTPASGSPPPRASHGLATDRARGRVVLFGGQGAADYADTWTWDGSAWARESPATSPPATAQHGMAFAPDRQLVLLFGGRTNAGPVATTWAWDGRNWALLPTATAPSPRGAAAVAYDEADTHLVVMGGTGLLDDTWRLRALGGACDASSAGMSCPVGASCVDGVCCNVSACGTCATCNGVTPGQCSPVLNAEDDTCTNGRACDAHGECKLALGQAATDGATCASGFVVDGVCCEKAACGPCEACHSHLKEVETRAGYCAPTRAGIDPHDSCAASDARTCGLDGTCDGRGACRPWVRGSACGNVTCNAGVAFGEVCDGLGACIVNNDGARCDGFMCTAAAGCLSQCASDADCATKYRCDEGRCVVKADAKCDTPYSVQNPSGLSQPCAPWACRGGRCLDECTSSDDCSPEAACDFSHKCVPRANLAFDVAGCAAARDPRDLRRARDAWCLVLGAAWALRARRRRRS